MLKLHVVQAEHGDSLILEYGTPSNPRYILIDGGPEAVYEEHLRGKLLDIRARGGKLDLVLLSHVDDDHICGLLDLMAELRRQRASHVPETIGVAELWHNTFSQTIGSDVEARFRMLVRDAGITRDVMSFSNRADRSIGQGDDLTRAATALDVRINPEFALHHLVCVDDASGPIVFGNLKLHVLGPTRQILEKLRKQWLAWLKKHSKRILVRDPLLAATAAKEADDSIPNLSSIMVLAEAEGKTILLTGDGRSDHLLQGLEQAHLLDPTGSLHVNVLKLPHHGSKRNVKKKFFKSVTADTYVICANGRDDNPDLTTLKWLVEAARERKRDIEIFVTNPTDSTRQLVHECNPDKYGYRLVEMKRGEHATPLELA